MCISVIGLILSVFAMALSAADPSFRSLAGIGNVVFGLMLIVSRLMLGERDSKEDQVTGEAGIEHHVDHDD
jgi:hypothetical protein